MADTILHNQPINNAPTDSERLAFGTPATPSGNITLANFYNLLMTKLGFFKVSNLFSEIFGNATAMQTARENIDAASVTDMTYELSLKANRGAVLEKTNTSSYTPTLQYHPSTKGYVDGFQPLLVGKVVDNGATMTGTKYNGTLAFTVAQVGSTYVITHNYNNSNYYVMCQVVNNIAPDVIVSVLTIDANSFSIGTYKDGFFQGSFFFEMKKLT